MVTPAGRVFCTSASRSLTRWVTTRLFSPISISAVPTTTSPSPLAVAAPRRSRGANDTAPRLPTVMGVPLLLAATTTLATSSRLVTSPSARMRMASRLRSM
jgi:hypothetical protein